MSEDNAEQEVAETLAPVEQMSNYAYGYTYNKDEKQFYRHTLSFNVGNGEAKVVKTEPAGHTRPLASFDANKAFTNQIMNIEML